MTNKKDDEKELVLPSSSPPDNEFISDAFNEDNINEEDLRAEMQQFGLTEEKKGNGKTDGTVVCVSQLTELSNDSAWERGASLILLCHNFERYYFISVNRL